MSNILPNFLSTQQIVDFKTAFNNALNLQTTKDIEIEIRIGTIIDTFTSQRIEVNSTHPILIKTPAPNMRFESGVDDSTFNHIINKFKDFPSEKIQDQITLLKYARITYVDGEIKECINKRKIKNYNIYLPGFDYDLRLGISREEKVPFKPFSKTMIISQRERDRTTFKIKDYSLDFTVVNYNNKKKYEVEVEVKNMDFDREEFLNVVYNLL